LSFLVRSSFPMSYFQFLLVFLVPAIGALVFRFRSEGGSRRRATYVRIAVIAAIALIYTTPWDNYLIAIGAWTYPPNAVLGTIGLVPIEEYCFFILQPFATGLLFETWKGPLVMDESGRKASVAGIIAGVALTALGGAAWYSGLSVYLGLILTWSGPVVVLQWGYNGRLLEQTWRAWLPPLVVATCYLWIADAIAIGLGIWSISTVHTVGWSIGGLPIEEMTFFLMTNAMVLFGVILLEGSGLGGRKVKGMST